jgi:hypothetical protein
MADTIAKLFDALLCGLRGALPYALGHAPATAAERLLIIDSGSLIVRAVAL